MPVNRCRVSRRFGAAQLGKTHEEDREQNADFLRRARFPQLLQLLLDRRLRRQWDRGPVVTLHAFRLRDEEGEGKGEHLQRDEGEEGLVVDCAFAITVSRDLARTKDSKHHAPLPPVERWMLVPRLIAPARIVPEFLKNSQIAK